MPKKKRKTAKPRRVRPGNNIKFLRQELNDLKGQIDDLKTGMASELQAVAERRQAILLNYAKRVEKLQRAWDRLANQVTEIERAD